MENATHVEAGPLRNPAGPRGRLVSDSRDMVGLPLVQAGDSVRAGVSEDAAGGRQLSFPGIGWRIKQPARRPGAKLPASQILDIHTSLLFLFSTAGFPEDGRIYFTRYQLLNLAGWLSPARDRRGAKVMRPGGRHYRQLDAALTYLMDAKYRNDSPNAFQVGPDGEVFRGSQWFPILQYARLAEDTPGPRSEGSPVPAPRCMVQFSDAFVKLIGQGALAAQMDLDLIMSLSTGTPRQLYRVFTWMRQEGLDRITIREMFERVGSTLAEFRPARARQILTKAHGELRQRGVITAEPEYLRDAATGEYWIHYAFADPRALLTEEEMLVQQAAAYGVSTPVSRELVVAHRLAFERVLAATTLGRLEPRKSLAPMIVHFTQRGYDIPEPRVAAPGSQLPLSGLEKLEMRYLVWAAEERTRLSAGRRDIDEAALRREVIRLFEERMAGHPEWVVDGMVAMRLNRLLGIPTYEQYREMQIRGLS
jgi:hypothetical protein